MLRARSFKIWFAWTLVLAASVAISRAAEKDSRLAAVQSITVEEVKEHVEALADDTFEGRASGSRGGRAAAIYIVTRLKKFGVTGGGTKDTFYQSFSNYHNILGWIEGRDPEVKNQVIIVGAHYDHVGYGRNGNSFGPIGQIHNGADDNASGVAGLLEVADALGQLPETPRRSILLAFWDGEEEGLLGSQHWVENPTVPLDHVPIAINADMIGRLRNARFDVYGTRTCRGLRRLVSQQNGPSDLLIDFHWETKRDSDHYSFFKNNIPYLMLHSGMHNDYHRPSDDADKINNEGLKQVAQLMFNLVLELAEGPDLSGFRRQARQETRADQQAAQRLLPPPPGRLGVGWDDKAAAEGTISIVSVEAGSAGEKGGLRVGDRVLKFAGRELHGPTEFRQSVLAARSPTSALIERRGEDGPRELVIRLPGEPVQLGVGWRVDDAEPGTLIVNRLTPGSPADLAGIRPNDRIQRIGGQEFANAEEFQRAAAATDGPLVLEIETAGRVRTVEIPPLDEAPQDPLPEEANPAPRRPLSNPLRPQAK